jgi:sialidase-1
MIQLRDGRILVVAWAYDRKNKRDLPNQYVISSDGGKTFSQPASTGLLGQTMTPIELSDGRLLSAYRRMDRPGLWAVISRLDGDRWVNDEHLGLWGTEGSGLVATTGNMVTNFARLQFGAPCLVDMGDGTVHVSFWAVEEGLASARWIKVGTQ